MAPNDEEIRRIVQEANKKFGQIEPGSAGYAEAQVSVPDDMYGEYSEIAMKGGVEAGSDADYQHTNRTMLILRSSPDRQGELNGLAEMIANQPEIIDAGDIYRILISPNIGDNGKPVWFGVRVEKRQGKNWFNVAVVVDGAVLSSGGTRVATKNAAIELADKMLKFGIQEAGAAKAEEADTSVDPNHMFDVCGHFPGAPRTDISLPTMAEVEQRAAAVQEPDLPVINKLESMDKDSAAKFLAHADAAMSRIADLIRQDVLAGKDPKDAMLVNGMQIIDAMNTWAEATRGFVTVAEKKKAKKVGFWARRSRK